VCRVVTGLCGCAAPRPGCGPLGAGPPQLPPLLASPTFPTQPATRPPSPRPPYTGQLVFLVGTSYTHSLYPTHLPTSTFLEGYITLKVYSEIPFNNRVKIKVYCVDSILLWLDKHTKLFLYSPIGPLRPGPPSLLWPAMATTLPATPCVHTRPGSHNIY
jgi:hypothetical protein